MILTVILVLCDNYEIKYGIYNISLKHISKQYYDNLYTQFQNIVVSTFKIRPNTEEWAEAHTQTRNEKTATEVSTSAQRAQPIDVVLDSYWIRITGP